MAHPSSTTWVSSGGTNSFVRSTWNPDVTFHQGANHDHDLFSYAEAPPALPNAFLPRTAIPLSPYGDGVHIRPEERSSISHFGNSESLPNSHNEPISHSNAQPNGRSSRRTNKRDGRWDQFKQTMRDLYITQDSTLEVVMGCLAKKGFQATKKQYKDQFKKWGWHKNLPGEKARFMRSKAIQRRRADPPKMTVFQWGGKEWTGDRITKSFREGNEDTEADVYFDEPTPFDIIYTTPSNHPSPKERVIHGTSPQAQANPRISKGSTNQVTGLRLRWNGNTVADIDRLRTQAVELERKSDFDAAGEKFREALDSCRNLLPPADDSTVAMTYQVAIFYALRDEMEKADAVIDALTDQLVDRWGKGHEKTLIHYATVARFLEAWDRYEDSLNIIRRLTENFSTDFVTASLNGNETHKLFGFDMPALQVSDILSGTAKDRRDLSQLWEVLQVQNEKAGVIALEGNDRLEQRVVIRLEQLMKDPEHNLVEIVRARSFLAKVYRESDLVDQGRMALAQARECVASLCKLQCKKPKAFFDAVIDLAQEHLVGGYSNDSEKLLDNIESEAVAELGADHHDTISLLIRIGKMVQRFDSWARAGPHFEQAYAACITALGFDAFITKRLEKCLEEGHYSNKLDVEEANRGGFQWITL